MIQLMLAAPRSGGGKTAAACALLRLLARRGLTPCAFKCGPDYLDPTFHRAVEGVESRNLDLFLSDADCVRSLYANGCKGRGAAVIEGAMGYYDGLGGVSDTASAWAVADTLGVSTLLIVPAKGASLTLAATVRGLAAFRAQSRVAGVLLNECSPALYAALAPTLEREGGVPVLGCLPTVEAARFPNRHLGLYDATELADVSARIDALADALDANLDFERLMKIYDAPAPTCAPRVTRAGAAVRIAVAEDAAFRFVYRETRETLEACGAELVPFSPINDAALPERVGGLYLPGGYPELHARALSDNAAMRDAVRNAVLGALPTVAECGGFLYLGASLRDASGEDRAMVGALSGHAADALRLVRFGYETLVAPADSLLFRAGERVRAHEFHHWDSTDCGDALTVEKGARTWRCGFVGATLYAAFPHLYFAGCPALAERFADAARSYGEAHGFA